MQAFGSAFGLGAFAPAADGAYRVAVRDLPIAFCAEADGMSCVLTADLGDVSGKGADVFLKEALGAMFMGGLGQGRWFSAAEESDALQLNARLDLQPLDADAFVAAVDRFAALACSWRELVSQWRRKSANEELPAGAAGNDGIRV